MINPRTDSLVAPRNRITLNVQLSTRNTQQICPLGFESWRLSVERFGRFLGGIYAVEMGRVCSPFLPACLRLSGSGPAR